MGTSLRHVRRLTDERRIPIAKVGRFVRFDAHEVEHWIDDHRIGVVDQAAVAGVARRRRTALERAATSDGHRPPRTRTA
jgi:excisionase family DNA binding protein